MTRYNDWIEFKKSFTNEQDDALYQYFIDHSKIQKNGYLGIQFYIKDMDDFWRRVFARFNGDFKRYDKLEKSHKQEMNGWYMMKKEADRHRKICEEIKAERNKKRKLILWLYRKTRDYLFS